MTFVSMDNCSHNGDKLKNGVVTIAKEWAGKGLVEEGFVTYLEDERLIAFPLSMIDKITPRPSKRSRRRCWNRESAIWRSSSLPRIPIQPHS